MEKRHRDGNPNFISSFLGKHTDSVYAFALAFYGQDFILTRILYTHNLVLSTIFHKKQ